ncbi:methyl-accepting chemotaxis protein [Brachyspira pilosicoli]|uniref:methyl-accepting chemotaxis protein n=1 Tax=Brachyspira pilosicoli TaxID=52584 RepID=UPI00254322F6|nr:methyl-accepting chemotaxis protein [Brachyspira pilosicoli]WIH87435.1 methyl-accepting chemotaxis protein [Brachyspira pilosicoli]
MAVDKFQHKIIFSLKMQLIFTYIIVNLPIWYIILYFFIYSHKIPFFGIKIIATIFSVISILKYFDIWKNGLNIQIARKTIRLFTATSIISSVLEIALYNIINKDVFIYTSIIAVIACLLVNGGAVSLTLLSFKIATLKLDLETNINTFYIPITTKILYTIYFFFFSVVLVFLIYSINVNENLYINNYINNTLNEIIKIDDNIYSLNNSIKNDLNIYNRVINNVYSNRYTQNRDILKTEIENRLSYIDRVLKNNYKAIYINIDREFLDSNLAYSISITKNASSNDNAYTLRTADSLTTHPILENNTTRRDFYISIIANDRNNINISAHYPITLNDIQAGYIISDININNYYSNMITNTSISDLSYIYYNFNTKEVLLSSEQGNMLENANTVLRRKSADLIKYLNEFESQLDNKSFYVTPILNINGNRTMVIMYYMKDLNISAVYYKDLTSIIKSSAIEREISIILSIVIIIFLVVSATYLYIIRQLFKPIDSATESAKGFIGGKGDLRKRIYSKNNDEIGVLVYNFNLFLNGLDDIIGNLKTESNNVFNEIKLIDRAIESNAQMVNDQSASITENIASVNNIINSIKNVTNSSEQQKHAFSSASIAVEELLQTIYKISDNMEKQASAVEQTSSSIEEMISNITSVAKSISKAHSFSKKLLIDAHDGGDMVDEVIEAVRGIEESSDQIKEIVNVIQGIAEQTNLLAMNAAIEAAHAGEQGRGFSVVADEIRLLAEHTADNTKTITNIIKTITKRIDETVELANNSGKSLENILDMSENTSRVVAEINTANSELEIGGRDILETIKHLNNITMGVKENVREQINSGDVVDSQITLLDQINKEVAEIIEANSVGATEVVSTMAFLNELSVKTAKSNHEFFMVTSKLSESFNKFQSLMSGFITNVDNVEEKSDDIILNLDTEEFDTNDIDINKINGTENKIDVEIKELEEELSNTEQNGFSKEDKVLEILKEDFKNPDMFY